MSVVAAIWARNEEDPRAVSVRRSGRGPPELCGGVGGIPSVWVKRRCAGDAAAAAGPGGI